jgi:hypothetical protein
MGIMFTILKNYNRAQIARMALQEAAPTRKMCWRENISEIDGYIT